MRPLLTVWALIGILCGQSLAADAGNPNIIFILADDIGYGDFGCYGATKVKTPNIDRLATQGLRFTDAHSPSAVCTPTRYAFMTGEYAWRKKGTGILPGHRRADHRAGPRHGAVAAQAGRLRHRRGRQVAPGPRGPVADRLQRRNQARSAGDRLRLRRCSSGHRRPHAVRVGREPPRRRPRPERPDPARLLRPARRAEIVRQRHPAHRQPDRRQGGAVEGRRDRRHAGREGRSRSSNGTRTSRSSCTSPRTTSTCRGCRMPGSKAPARPASGATRFTRSTGPSARCWTRSTG